MSDKPTEQKDEKRPENPLRKIMHEKTPDERMLLRLKAAAYRAEGYTGFAMRVQDGDDPPGYYMLKDAKRFPVDTDPEKMPKDVAERFQKLTKTRGIDPETGKRLDGKPNPDFTKRRHRTFGGLAGSRLARPHKEGRDSSGQDGHKRKKKHEGKHRGQGHVRDVEPLGGLAILNVLAQIQAEHPEQMAKLLEVLQALTNPGAATPAQTSPGQDGPAQAEPREKRKPAAQHRAHT